MKKFWFLVKRGFRNRVMRKAFVISNIFMMIVSVLLACLPTIINANTNTDPIKMAVWNNSTYEVAESIDGYFNSEANKEALSAAGIYGVEYNQLNIDTKISSDEFFDNETYKDYQLLLIIDGNTLDSAVVSIYNKTASSSFIVILQSLIENDYYNNNTFYIEVITKEEEAFDGMEIAIASVVSIPIFMLVILATQLIGVDIVDEKSSKAIEIIISSVTAKSHFLSKILSTVAFVITQIVLLIVYFAIGMLISGLVGGSSSGDPSLVSSVQVVLGSVDLATLVAMVVLFTIAGAALYLVIGAFIASLATTQEDFAQLQTPIMLFLMASFYFAIYNGMAGEGALIWVRIFSYFPLTAPIVALASFAIGSIALYEAFISLIIVGIFIVGLIYLLSPIYRVSILSYDNGKLFSRIKKAYSSSRTAVRKE